MATPPSTVLRRGFTRRCAVCGQGHLFRHWVRMAPTCPQCGLRFARIPGHWLGSWFLNVCLAQVVVLGILIIGVAITYPDPPMLVLGVIDASAAVVVPLAFFPFSRTIWTAIDLVMRPADFYDDVAPGYLLEEDIARLRDERDAA
ncbi:DUF983 domain-containing protein [Rhabdothermincola salaria]|uniref:DUF983 domain-containing protein n=1 Tax=Rhabdothermincola salaria TaxID=2903142 RepID=UPI001E63031D|nr:DUF983 domain-containing protein [Rhabdothermincola salaria]MCD9623544.1 DUF983 domain-containing protein [Rhabdothermincola salaria]